MSYNKEKQGKKSKEFTLVGLELKHSVYNKKFKSIE